MGSYKSIVLLKFKQNPLEGKKKKHVPLEGKNTVLPFYQKKKIQCYLSSHPNFQTKILRISYLQKNEITLW